MGLESGDKCGDRPLGWVSTLEQPVAAMVASPISSGVEERHRKMVTFGDFNAGISHFSKAWNHCGNKERSI